MIAAIVAVDNNWGIGFNGELLEKIPEDMKYFQQLVTNKIVITGRKTWDSIPKTEKFTSRNSYLILSSQYEEPFLCIANSNIAYCHLDKLKQFISLPNREKDIVVIGGGQIYKELLPYCDRVYVTKIYKDHENVDTYFPNLDESDEWAPASMSDLRTHDELSYQFWEYDRIS